MIFNFQKSTLVNYPIPTIPVEFNVLLIFQEFRIMWTAENVKTLSMEDVEPRKIISIHMKIVKRNVEDINVNKLFNNEIENYEFYKIKRK